MALMEVTIWTRDPIQKFNLGIPSGSTGRCSTLGGPVRYCRSDVHFHILRTGMLL